MTKSYVAKHIIISILARIAIFLVISFEGANILFDQYDSIRNDVYGIGNYVNIRFVSNMMLILNAVFLIAIVISCFMTRRTLYTKENVESPEFKKYVRFELILESAASLGYVLLTTVIASFVDSRFIKTAMLVPKYAFYYITENNIIATILSIAIYAVVILFILALPYLKNKRNNENC